jgi:hypothetical protein
MGFAQGLALRQGCRVIREKASLTKPGLSAPVSQMSATMTKRPYDALFTISNAARTTEHPM